jgi:hypothetical protein
VLPAAILLGHHRRVVEGRPLASRQKWQREVRIDDVRAAILRKVEAIERARRIRTERAWAAALTGQSPREVPTATNLRLAYRPGAPCNAGRSLRAYRHPAWSSSPLRRRGEDTKAWQLAA